MGGGARRRSRGGGRQVGRVYAAVEALVIVAVVKKTRVANFYAVGKRGGEGIGVYGA